MIWNEGDWLLCPPAAWGHCCSWTQEHLLCPLPWTRVPARDIVSNVGWAALPRTLFCIKHFPPWKLPWLTAHFKIVINVFAQGFWNLISLFWTLLKSVCLEKQKIPPLFVCFLHSLVFTGRERYRLALQGCIFLVPLVLQLRINHRLCRGSSCFWGASRPLLARAGFMC